MAHIEKRKLHDGSTAFKVVWTDPSGKRQSKQFSKATGPRPGEAAKAFMGKLEQELRLGTYVDIKAGDVTFQEYAERWFEHAPYRASSRRAIEKDLRLYIYPTLGPMRMSAIRPRDVQALVDKLMTTPLHYCADRMLCPKTIDSVLRTVRVVFNKAVREKLIHESPCGGVRLPEVQKAKIVIPTPEQVTFIADNVAPRYRALVLLAAGTGLRSSELRGLDQSRLRVLERIVKVDRQLLVSRPGGPKFGPPKTNASYREVPLAPSYAEVAAEHLAEFGTGIEGLVFHNLHGTQVSSDAASDALISVVRDAGLPERTGLHVFRHYYASGLIAAGLDVLVVMRLLGHATVAETLGTYGHLWHDHEERTRQAIETAFPAPGRARRSGLTDDLRRGALRGARGSRGGAVESLTGTTRRARHTQTPRPGETAQ